MSYSQITDRLFIGGQPAQLEHDLLRQLGVRLVICMRFWLRRRAAGMSSVRYLSLPTLDSPLLPIPVKVLVQGATAALEVMEAGGKVYTYCARGRHRSVAMGAAILIAQGLSAEQAMALIKQQRATADPEVHYIQRQIRLFEKQWRALRGSERAISSTQHAADPRLAKAAPASSGDST